MLFADLEPPPTPEPEPKPDPPRKKFVRDPELEAAIASRTDETVARSMDVLRALGRAAGGYFRSRSEGAIYKRDPALKITLVVPDGEDGIRAKVAISPGIATNHRRGDDRRVSVDPSCVHLVLFQINLNAKPGMWGSKWYECFSVRACLSGEVQREGRWYPMECDVHAEKLCTTAARFVADPAAAVAASGTNCAFCGRALTDPQSRIRGIGPECFGHYGDFLHHLVPAPQEQPA